MGYGNSQLEVVGWWKTSRRVHPSFRGWRFIGICEAQHSVYSECIVDGYTHERVLNHKFA